MTSVISICNLALTELGKKNITSLSEASPEARACNQMYDFVRDLLLQSYPWRFAGKTQSLAELENDKPGAWAHSYRKPTDCLKIRSIRPWYSLTELGPTVQEEAMTPFEFEGDRVYCSLSPAFLRYTYRVTDPTKYPPLFIDALVWHLATRMAMPLTKDPKERANAFQIAQATTASAQMADANEQRETSDHSSELVAGRG